MTNSSDKNLYTIKEMHRRAAELEISQGNHLVLLPGLEGERQKVVPEALKGVHIAHYPWRSEEQAAKKAAVGWLGNVAKYTRYTRIANQWRDGYRELMKGRSLQPEPLRHPVKAPRLPGSEVVRLCYTPDYDRENLLELVMGAAEQMAEECAEFRARLLRQTVSLLMLYKGNIELFAKTLASALAGITASIRQQEFIGIQRHHEGRPLCHRLPHQHGHHLGL